MKLLDQEVQKLVENFTGSIKRYPAGQARADVRKKTEQAEFKCSHCGFIGKISFERLRRHRPTSLHCRRCHRQLQ